MIFSKNLNHHFFIYGIILLIHHHLKENSATKEANDTELAHKEEKSQVFDLKYHMDKTILKIATLKRSAHLNMYQPREEHDEALNATKDNGAIELRQI